MIFRKTLASRSNCLQLMLHCQCCRISNKILSLKWCCTVVGILDSRPCSPGFNWWGSQITFWRHIEDAELYWQSCWEGSESTDLIHLASLDWLSSLYYKNISIVFFRVVLFISFIIKAQLWHIFQVFISFKHFIAKLPNKNNFPHIFNDLRYAIIEINWFN